MEQIELKLVLAYDHGIEHGPIDFNEKNIDPKYILELAKEFDAVVLQKGVAEKYFNNQTKLVLKLNGKGARLCSLEEAYELGASAVGYTVYLNTPKEKEMLEELAEIEEKSKVPVIGWMYGKTDSAYAARIGLELGVEYVKIKYDNKLSLAVRAAGKVKVLVSGGKKDKNFLKMAQEVMNVGAYGMIVGRNIWQDKEPEEMTKKLREIIYGFSKT